LNALGDVGEVTEGNKRKISKTLALHKTKLADVSEQTEKVRASKVMQQKTRNRYRDTLQALRRFIALLSLYNAKN